MKNVNCGELIERVSKLNEYIRSEIFGCKSLADVFNKYSFSEIDDKFKEYDFKRMNKKTSSDFFKNGVLIITEVHLLFYAKNGTSHFAFVVKDVLKSISTGIVTNNVNTYDDIWIKDTCEEIKENLECDEVYVVEETRRKYS